MKPTLPPRPPAMLPRQGRVGRFQPTRRGTRFAWVALMVVLAGLAWDAAAWWRIAQQNDRIAAVAKGDTGLTADDATEAPPQLRFAQAAALAARGADEAALNRYRALQPDAAVGAAARFNSANLLVRQAIALRAGPQPGQAIALFELAKEYYRDVLRDDPLQWDARYNLERLQRLWPDPDEDPGEPTEQSPHRERAVTTMRGHAPGLP